MAPSMPDYAKRWALGLAFWALCLGSMYTFSFSATSGKRAGAMIRDLLAGSGDKDYSMRMRPTQSGGGACPVLTAPRGCEAQHFAAVTSNSSDSEVFQTLDRAFDCLIQHLVMPAIAGRDRRKLRNRKIAGCNSGKLVAFGTTQAEGWRAMAERRLCILEEQLYSIATSCRLSLQRGMYIKSAR